MIHDVLRTYCTHLAYSWSALNSHGKRLILPHSSSLARTYTVPAHPWAPDIHPEQNRLRDSKIRNPINCTPCTITPINERKTQASVYFKCYRNMHP